MNKREWKKNIISTVILVAVIIGVIMFNFNGIFKKIGLRNNDNQKKFENNNEKEGNKESNGEKDTGSSKDNVELISYSRSYGGDMLGSHDSIVIKKLDDGKVFVSKANAPWHNADPTVEEYYVSEKLLADIYDIIKASKIDECEKWEESDLMVLDGGSTSYSFTLSDGSRYNFNSNLEFPEEALDGICRIRDLISDELSNAEKLPGLVVENNSEDEYYSYEIEEGRVIIQVYEYSEDYLYYRILNGCDRDIEIAEKICISKLNDEDSEVVFTSESEYGQTAYSDSVSEESVELINGRLDAGKYVLQIDKYEVEFEIR